MLPGVTFIGSAVLRKSVVIPSALTPPSRHSRYLRPGGRREHAREPTTGRAIGGDRGCRRRHPGRPARGRRHRRPSRGRPHPARAHRPGQHDPRSGRGPLASVERDDRAGHPRRPPRRPRPPAAGPRPGAHRHGVPAPRGPPPARRRRTEAPRRRRRRPPPGHDLRGAARPARPRRGDVPAAHGAHRRGVPRAAARALPRRARHPARDHRARSRPVGPPRERHARRPRRRRHARPLLGAVAGQPPVPLRAGRRGPRRGGAAARRLGVALGPAAPSAAAPDRAAHRPPGRARARRAGPHAHAGVRPAPRVRGRQPESSRTTRSRGSRPRG